jgi:organic radical activating enzyme
MRISEIFYSTQGEGPKIREKRIFIRLAKCNLKCKFCDTKYAYKGEEYEIGSVINRIKSYDCKHLIWTGGEPTLQINEIVRLINKLKDYSHDIETNGTNCFPVKLFSTAVISPKKQAINEALITEYKKCKNVYFKFVVENRRNYEFWKKLIRELKIPKNKIYFMPEAKDKKTLFKKSKWLRPKTMEDNFNFSIRLQILEDFR